ncbi:hypothetical protein K7X08_020920 [Anisodus acutangulus]|uniref:Uncharacterized protein n=1 Tax=Anisodus acutangulus TaxID=402998 RepID=A0A9Q1RMW5_9SOLA|nr:hypothetical protein K7X08_020920 [Anisodus acutangulus]
MSFTFFFPTDCSYRRQWLCWLCKAICKAAVSEGIEVISLSRLMGGSSHLDDRQVHFFIIPLRDVFYANWDEVLAGLSMLLKIMVSSFRFVYMKKSVKYGTALMCLRTTLRAGIPTSQGKEKQKFVPNSLTQFRFLKLLSTVAPCVVLRPAFIYGKRKINGFEIPLDLIGEPLEKLLRARESFTKPLNSLPASDLVLAPPVSVDDVDCFGIFTFDQIKAAAAKGAKV